MSRSPVLPPGVLEDDPAHVVGLPGMAGARGVDLLLRGRWARLEFWLARVDEGLPAPVWVLYAPTGEAAAGRRGTVAGHAVRVRDGWLWVRLGPGSPKRALDLAGQLGPALERALLRPSEGDR